jgi:co-chaperonin GroES (HSP10)
MGQAKVKRQRREQQSAKVLLNRQIAATRIEPLRKFDRDRYECAPDTAIVRRDAPKTMMSESGVVAQKAKRAQTGIVEVSGFDWLKPGDKVLFSKFGGSDIELDDAELVHVHRLQIYVREKATA